MSADSSREKKIQQAFYGSDEAVFKTVVSPRHAPVQNTNQLFTKKLGFIIS
jgi:hypothetical protein